MSADGGALYGKEETNTEDAALSSPWAVGVGAGWQIRQPRQRVQQFAAQPDVPTLGN